jgi:uncharacterized protein DUF2842
MSPRTKKLVGTIFILIWISIYSLLAMGVGVRMLPHANGFVVFLYYLLAGTLWIIPVGLLFPWMYRDPRERNEQRR